MNKHSALRTRGSLLERAAEIYDFRAALNDVRDSGLSPESQVRPAPLEESRPASPKPVGEIVRSASAAARTSSPPVSAPRPSTPQPRETGRRGIVDSASLAEAGYILPDAPVTGLAEEFRIIKRQLLLGVGKPGASDEKSRSILICSAQPDEGKTFCAVNLALSLASEKDIDILLVDGDFPKPEILSTLGLEGEKGLIDAIADPDIDPESLVIATDIGGLSVLPAGSHVNNVTELLSSSRTREVLTALTSANPRRLVLFDSPPALVASPATVLATHVGQLVMVVRADRTTEADLKEAVGLLSGCEDISLILNGAGFAANGRRFGSYYGYGQ
jgi:exopolysaccharide/PEP-CTERM locus tyrosine autokinase